jgi:hypothetical protein
MTCAPQNNDDGILADIGKILDRADELERRAKANPPKEMIPYPEFIRRLRERQAKQ